MSEEYVNREEFNNLKQDVQELKEEVNEYKSLLQKIDKKIDVISERMTSADKIDELKMQPLVNRVQKLEDNQSWLSKTIAGTIIGISIKILFDIYKYKIGG